MRLNYTFAALFSALIAGALFILLKGGDIGLTSVALRWLAVAGLLVLFLLSVITHILLVRRARRQAALREIGSAKIELTPPASEEQRHTWRLLVDDLRDQNGLRWRYRQPWLLLTGNDTAITQRFPKLADQGHLVTEDVVLVWRACDSHGQPDEAWLKQLARLRRRRPVDGVVLLVDGHLESSATVRALPAHHTLLSRIARTWHWSAPVYVLDVAHVKTQRDGDTLVAGCEFTPSTEAEPINDHLLALRDRLARVGVQHLGADLHNTYAAELSQHLDRRSAVLASGAATLATRHASVRGVFFASVPVTSANDERNDDATLPPLWSHVGQLARRQGGQRTAWHPITVSSVIALSLISLWTIGMGVSAVANGQAMDRSLAVAQSLHRGDDAARLRALLALQQRIGVYEERMQQHTSGLRGFGLNHDRDTLDALWAHYATASRAALSGPVQLALANALADFGNVRADALQDHTAQRRSYDQLKAYLMLAEPSRVDAGFLAEQIATALPVVTTMPIGEWQDTSQRLAAFFANHLKAHPAWRIEPIDTLVTTARATLVNQIGLANAEDTIYQSVINSLQGKYADMSLAALLNGTSAQGLFTTSATVPGIYTRAAWEGMVAEAIAKAASERRVEGDWVLTGGAPAVARAGDATPDKDLKQRLTDRYFADYAAAWQQMLNSLQWQPAGNLNEAINQLTRLTDAQTSPLIALMTSVQHQAQAGRASQALGDTLVRRAQGILGHEEKATGPVVNPLDAAFGPLLMLMGDSGVTGRREANGAGGAISTPQHGVSLQSYLTAALTMRLKLQQIGSSPDAQAMARAAAQAAFQGKLSDLAQVREQAALTSASLGSAWAGLGDALFARPLDGAWQTILQPAAASLNDVWRETIAAPFNSAFNGRYPFYDTAADASFAELGRYARPDSGLIPRFLTTELAGVLTPQGDQWVPNGLAPQTLAFDPAFLKAMQQMALLGARLYAQGDAGYHFEIMPQPTPNVTRSTLTIDKQQIVYFNQQESWTLLAWPGDGLNGHVSLTWQTLDAGVRQVFDGTGDWAFLRLLAKADVKPLDSTRYALSWKQPDAETLRYVMRTKVGEGPLDLLALRDFKLPERIFVMTRKDAPNAGPSRTTERRTP